MIFNVNDLIYDIIKTVLQQLNSKMQCYALIGNVLIDKSYTAYSKVTKLIKEEIYIVKVNCSVQGKF